MVSSCSGVVLSHCYGCKPIAVMLSHRDNGLQQLQTGMPCVCSDILTPLPALGVPFEIDDVKGPLIANPVRTLDQVWCSIATKTAR